MLLSLSLIALTLVGVLDQHGGEKSNQRKTLRHHLIQRHTEQNSYGEDEKGAGIVTEEGVRSLVYNPRPPLWRIPTRAFVAWAEAQRPDLGRAP